MNILGALLSVEDTSVIIFSRSKKISESSPRTSQTATGVGLAIELNYDSASWALPAKAKQTKFSSVRLRGSGEGGTRGQQFISI